MTATYCPGVWTLLSGGLLTQALHPLRSRDRTEWVDTPGSGHDSSPGILSSIMEWTCTQSLGRMGHASGSQWDDTYSASTSAIAQ